MPNIVDVEVDTVRDDSVSRLHRRMQVVEISLLEFFGTEPFVRRLSFEYPVVF